MKGMSSTMQIIVAVFGFGLVATAIGGGFLYFNGQASQVPGEQPEQQKQKPAQEAPWEGRAVKQNIRVRDLSGSDVTSGTLHIYKQKPDEWNDPQTIDNTYGTNEEYTTYSIESDGITTIQETPGTYYVAIEHSGAYTSFQTVKVPDGSQFPETTLNEYNQAPRQSTFTVADRYSLGASSIDLGVDSNTTSSQEWFGTHTYTPSDNTEYRLSHVVVQTGAVDFTTDSDSDGVYDEGIEKAYVEVTGARDADAKKSVFFEPNSGVDQLGADDKTKVNMDGMTFDNNHRMTAEFGVTTVETSTTAQTDGDEVLGDGENPIDFNFCDVAGNCNTVKDVTA